MTPEEQVAAAEWIVNAYEMTQEQADAAFKGATILGFMEDEGSYEGEMYVLFFKGGKLWEMTDSHCSCNGWDEWKPEETTLESVFWRNPLEWKRPSCGDRVKRLNQIRREKFANEDKYSKDKYGRLVEK